MLVVGKIDACPGEGFFKWRRKSNWCLKRLFRGLPRAIFNANRLTAQKKSNLSQEAYTSLVEAYVKRALCAP